MPMIAFSLREYPGDSFNGHPKSYSLKLRARMSRTLTILLFCFFAFSSLNAQWVELSTGTNALLRDVHFLDHEYGAVVGNNGTVLLTENAGQDWISIGGAISEDLSSVLVWNRDTLLVSGQTSGLQTTFLSTNGGMDWIPVNEAMDVKKMGQRILSCGHDTFDWSDDQGVNWTPTEATIGGTTLISEIDIADEQTAIASGNVGGFAHYSYYAYRTIDAGKSWEPLYVFDLPNSDAWTASAFPEADTLLVFTNEQVNFLPGPNNQLVRLTNFYYDTQNGINSWRFSSETINSATPTYVHDAAFVDSRMGYIVGENGQIYRTLDGGDNWSSIYAGTTNLESIALIDMEIAYVVGADGLILKNENLTSSMNPSNPDLLKIWPNPSTDWVQIEGVDQASTDVFLYNMSGQLIKRLAWQEGSPISLVDLPKGQYQLVVQLKRQRVSYPVIKH